MALFSERYKYKKVSEVIIRECITPEIQNAICTCYDKLAYSLACKDRYSSNYFSYTDVEKFLWTNFLNEREANFYGYGNEHEVVATTFIEDASKEWYEKLDLIEMTVKYLAKRNVAQYTKFFVDNLNYSFQRLNFAYRVVGTEIVEVTSELEIKTIESSISESSDNVKMHLSKALELYAKRPVGDYRNSIKESISAIEAFCRKITGKNSLGEALNQLENNGISISPILKTAFDKLYAYSNQKDTGIRHAMMEEQSAHAPNAEEALFMLVSCSAFINYLRQKSKV